MNLKNIILTTILASTSIPAVEEDTKDYLHFSISGASSMASSFVLDNTNNKLSLGDKCIIGFGIGLLPGFFKEIADYSRGYDFSIKDMGIDAMGSAFGSIFYYEFKSKGFIRFSNNKASLQYNF